ncbi:hypothetical protein [Flavobacterium sp.]|uniref:hypothetical protein n=1 Tax=Flavobacterium sp. TaxID=239 RepID=UPI0025C2C4D3|nr:hypothetical protein [Flavobacterium sp.]
MAKKITDKEYLLKWREFCENLDNATPIDLTENASDKIKRIKHLEDNPEEWFKYYFPNYYTSEPADFHIKATRRVLKNSEWYEVRSWARELSKSGRTMMEVLYLTMTGKKHNVLLVSNSADNAERLLLPYKANLERNNRLINDYGQQRRIGSWESNEFKTRKNVSFRALGVGQSPRGTRNEAKRPDVILVDDIDTDEICRNEDRVKENVKWIEQALIPTRSISTGLLLIACGNIIAKYCCISEMAKKADKHDIVNIRDEEGKSTWPQKNSEEQIDRVLEIISAASGSKEYFNNPEDDGDIFKELIVDQLPQLRHCDYVVIYADPAPSNKDKTTSSGKGVVVIGRKGIKYGVYKVWLNQMTNAAFVDYMFEAYLYVKNAGVDPINIFIENNTLQDPFYEQVLLPLIFKTGDEKGIALPITPDERKKPDKHVRIEGTLEPKNRLGQLIFNKAEEKNPHMERLMSQFTSFNMKSKKIDGPDAVEGGVVIIENKAAARSVDGIEMFKRKANKYKM